jgi:hypothetical protein
MDMLEHSNKEKDMKIIYDVEFELVNNITGRAIILADSVEEVKKLLNNTLLEQGYAVDNNDRYDIIALDFKDESKAIIIGVEQNDG